MAKDFTILSIGLVFVLVDIHPGGIEILPDFVGYGLIAWAAHSLSQYTEAFKIARNLALPLIAFSLFVFFFPQFWSPALLALGSILKVVMIWFLLGSVIRFADARDRPDLADHGLIYRRIYVGIAVVALLFQMAAQFRPEAAGGFVDLMMAVTVVILALILRLIYIIRQDIALDSTAIRG